MIGKKAGDEDKRGDKVVWDGHTASMERATKLAQANITLDEQIEAIHKAKGLMYVYEDIAYYYVQISAVVAVLAYCGG